MPITLFLKRLSVTGVLLRLISLFGLYRIWQFASIAWHAQNEGSQGLQVDTYAYDIIKRGALLGVWETAAITAALWAAAWTFDNLKIRRFDKQNVFKSAWFVGLFVLAGEIPAAFAPRTVISARLPFYFDYNSIAICAIAFCLMLAITYGHRLRAELDQIV